MRDRIAQESRGRAENPIDARKGLHMLSLPLWRGVARKPGNSDEFPFALSWDPHGFIAQSTPAAVRHAVVAAYAKPDYEFITAPPGNSAWASHLGNMWMSHMRRMVGRMNALRVLEIGAGSTYIARHLLEEFDIRHYVIVDPAMADDASEQSRLQIINGYFPQAALNGENFDLVVSLNCLEHVEDPVSFLAAIRRVLDGPEARAFLTFPDVSRQFAIGDLNALLHEHTSYLDAAGAKNLFRAAALAEIDKISEDDTFIMVARADARLQHGGQGPANNLMDRAKESFGPRLRALCEDMNARHARGDYLVFHGANNGLNNLLHLAGLAMEERIVVVDGDRQKQGLFIPACLTPIALPSSETYSLSDVVFVSAMSFHEEIRTSAVRAFGIDPRRIRPLYAAEPNADDRSRANA